MQDFYQLSHPKCDPALENRCLVLTDHCSTYINANVTTGNWEEALKLAINLNSDELKAKAISVIPNSISPQVVMEFLLQFITEKSKQQEQDYQQLSIKLQHSEAQQKWQEKQYAVLLSRLEKIEKLITNNN